MEEANLNSRLKSLNEAIYYTPTLGSQLTITEEVATSFAQGDLRETGNNFDLALANKGFFVVEKEDGTRGYTRDGAFMLNESKELVASKKLTNPEETVTFTYNYNGNDCSIQFGDSPTVTLENCSGSIEHTYEKAGVYKVRLYSNNEEVASVPIIVQNADNEWIGFVSSLDYYVEENEETEDFIKDGRMYISPSLSDRSYYWTNFRYVKPEVFNSVSGDDFILEARIKNPSSEGGISCYDPGIRVWGETGNAAGVTFMSPGCTYYASVGAAEWWQNGGAWNCEGSNTCENVDLSALGRDFSDWRVVKLEVKDRSVNVYFEGEKIYTMEYKGQVGSIQGIYFSFKGSGSVDWVKLYDGNGNLVYERDF
jgi:hypothetical protein